MKNIKNIFQSITLLALLTCFAGIAGAQPVNDLCSGAIELVLDSPTCVVDTFELTAATTNSGELPAPPCGFHNGGPDLWFYIVVPPSGAFTITSATTNGIGDGAMTTYTGSCGSLAILECDDDDGPGLFPEISRGFETPGDTIWIRYYEFGGNVLGTFGLCATADTMPPPPPSNDDCDSAIVLTVADSQSVCGPVTVAVNSVNATQSSPNPSCTSISNNDDVWYSFTATAEGVQVQFENIVGGVSVGSALYDDAPCGALGANLFCDFSSSGTAPDLSDQFTGLTIGNAYLLRVWIPGSTTEGTWDMCVFNLPPPPSNDDCDSAITITQADSQAVCGPVTVSVNTVTATQSTPPPSCTSISNNDDVWYRFTATTSSVRVEFDNIVGGVSVGSALYDDVACGALGANLFCDFASAGTAPDLSDVFSGLTVGNSYLLRVWIPGSTTSGTFDMCVFGIPPTSNDSPCGATFLGIPTAVGTSVPFDLATASADIGEVVPPAGTGPGATCNTQNGWCAIGVEPAVQRTLWYVFIAPAGGNVTIDAGPGDTQLALWFVSDCNNYLSFAFTNANDDSGPGLSAQIGDPCGAVSLIPFAPYYIQLDAFGTSVPSGTLTIKAEPAPLGAPTNDECAGALPISVAVSQDSCTATAVNTSCATQSTPNPGCTSISNNDDVWYEFTATSAAIQIQFDNIVGGTSVGSAIYADSCNGPELICDFASAGANPDLSDKICGLTIGNTYLLRVWIPGSTNQGTFDMCVFDLNSPSNDECTSPQSIACGDTIMGNTENACPDDAPTCGTTDGTGGGVWFSFTGTGGFVTASTDNPGTDYDTKIRIYTNDCDSLVCVDGDDDGGTGLTSLVEFCSELGTEYLILVHGFSTSEGNFEFSLTCDEPLTVDAGDCQSRFLGYSGPGYIDTNYLVPSAMGGLPPYCFEWDPACLFVGPNGGCAVQPGVPTTYTVTVTDARGCTAQGSVFVDVIDVTCVIMGTSSSGSSDDIPGILVCVHPQPTTTSPSNSVSGSGSGSSDDSDDPVGPETKCIPLPVTSSPSSSGSGSGSGSGSTDDINPIAALLALPNNHLGPCGNPCLATNPPFPSPPDSCTASAIDDFDPGIDSTQWALINNGAASADCGAVSGNALYFNGAGDRSATLTERAIGPNSGLSFSLIIGTGSAPCENADAGEDVVVEYSVDGGCSFEVFGTFDSEDFPTFMNITQRIPCSAESANTTIRIRQVSNSGNDFDNWAIDDVEIVCLPPLPPAPMCTAFDIDDFDPGINNPIWDTIQNGTADTGCGSVSGNALYFDGSGTRAATTIGLSLGDGAEINFSLKIGTESFGSTCENSDAGEDVVLEYSTDGGTNFNVLATYDSEDFADFTAITEEVPCEAQTSSTILRWRQLANSGSGFDNWALDDISVSCAALKRGQDNQVNRRLFSDTDDDLLSKVVNAYPNPFTGYTNITFSMDEDTRVELHIFNTAGAYITTLFEGDVKAGASHTVVFNASDLPTGIYIYRLTDTSDVHYGKLSHMK